MCRLAENDVILTRHGIWTTPVPCINCTTHRKAVETIKRYQQWLLANTLRIASRVGHDHIVILFQNEMPGKFPQCTINSLVEYLERMPGGQA